MNQSFTDFELILLNDASPDNSEEIIKTFKDARIRYYRNEKNLGISASRNKLMTLARGEYLIVMDDDDISLPNRLEEQIKFMDSHPDVTMAGSWCELFSRKPDKGIINYLKYCFYNLGWIWTQKTLPAGKKCFVATLLCTRPPFCGANTLNSIRFAITPTTVLPKTMTSAAKYCPPDLNWQIYRNCWSNTVGLAATSQSPDARQ